MKKSLIAGAGLAAFGFAGLPFMGAFADVTSKTDTIDVILGTTCTINSYTHDTGTAAEHSSSTATSWSSDTLTAYAVAGAAYTNIGATNFNIVCNNKNGWNVSASASALTGQTTAAETIPVGTVAANTTGWSYTPSTTDTDHITAGSANDTPVATSKLKTGEASHATGNDGRSFKVQYAVSTGNDVSAQTYEGSIAYTLNQVTGSGSGS